MRGARGNNKDDQGLGKQVRPGEEDGAGHIWLAENVLRGDTMPVCKYLGGFHNRGESTSSRCSKEDADQWRARLEIWKNSFAVRTAKQWDRRLGKGNHRPWRCSRRGRAATGQDDLGVAFCHEDFSGFPAVLVVPPTFCSSCWGF